ncbi:MAG: tRNA epoxyqueuosine(34) reductase QueG [bacterium]|nr:tRNA epoxyqueuosine(34) reductase QueG [bacterium]
MKSSCCVASPGRLCGPPSGRVWTCPRRTGPAPRNRSRGPTERTEAVDRGRLTRELRQRAASEGFDAIGIAEAVEPRRDAQALARWLGAGHQAGMTWLDRAPEMRSDPRMLLPGCRSVVSLALNYWPGAEEARTPPGRARVALYARGRDYHRVMGKRLKRLTAWLEETTGQATRSFVDTGPVLERAWAERAGIGWIGKNANLISRGRGSWLLLAELLTAAELVADTGPHEEFCGTCTSCLDACPTGAIVEDGVVDSERCISYWTIEHRGPIPEERRAGNADWIFGCDVCQDVCPWNLRFAEATPADPLERREDLRGLDPIDMLGLDEEAFRARYSGTSLMRAKWEGMRRNACIVLGNAGDRAALTHLARALDDEDPVVRSHAEWAIRQIEGRGADDQGLE